MQGLGFTAGYFPEGWFANDNVEPETHYLEAESTRSQHRPERVQWLGVQIAELAGEWMAYNGHMFSVGEKAKEYFDADAEEWETIVRLAQSRERYHHVVIQRFLTFAFGPALILVVLFVLFPRPVVATQICHSSLRTSRANASAEALSNNIDDFCLDVTNKEPLITIGWTWSKIYYRNTPEEYAMP
ncbi:hypothetical protein V502_02343 [Pseudogymnoascus sp. VKM F-4520 (FW-2644)]|nr:hypothetical protein V502_02343 [Pseudogymnoascus sp. VKM F-4520 (FW-2644)]